MSIGRDMKTKDIDSLVDMLVNVQTENGIKPTMQEALFDPNTKERINIFKRKKLEAQGVDLSKYGENTPTCNGSCNKCSKSDKHMSNLERGVFVYNEDDLIDEEEGNYVCEYCTKIGYDGSYKPDICDTCDDCEGCTEYIGNECDGCAYSAIYNGGMSYGQSTQDTSLIESEDQILLDEITEGGPDYEKKFSNGKFTILKF